MKSKTQIISNAFDELRINGITSKADNEDIALALDSLEQVVSEFPFDIGYRFESNPDPNTLTGIPQYAERAVYMALAVRLAPRYGKDASIYRNDAASALNALYSRVRRVPQVYNSPRMPMGMGNRAHYPKYNQFMPPTSAAPVSVNTEQFVNHDKRIISVDFSDYLAANESISSYSIESAQNLEITGDSFDGAVITLTVEPSQTGYQFIEIKVTGDAGTVANRRIDFEVSDYQSIRGNP